MPEIKTGEFGADMEGVRQEIYDIFPDIDDIWEEYGWEIPVIVSGTDAAEGRVATSLHSEGKAIDIRARYMPDDEQDELAHDLQVRIGIFYQVASEHFDDKSLDHLHIEAQASVTHPKAKIRDRRTKKGAKR